MGTGEECFQSLTDGLFDQVIDVIDAASRLRDATVWIEIDVTECCCTALLVEGQAAVLLIRVDHICASGSERGDFHLHRDRPE